MAFIRFVCKWENSVGLADCISILIAFATLLVTISIPIQIMKFQRYLNLMPTYMGFDVANAQKGVIDFFHDDCNCDVERIPVEYKRRFLHDFNPNNHIDKIDILHYQRRLLNDFFFELEKCRESSWILKRWIERNWTSSEAWVVKILIFMNAAVDNDPELYKDISSIKHAPMPKTKGLNKHLEKFYDFLRHGKRWMP